MGGGTVVQSAWQRLIQGLSSCIQYLDVETWFIRWVFARSIALGVTVPAETGIVVVEPSLDDGNRIHQELQKRFVRYCGPGSALGHELVVERTAHLRPDIEEPLEMAVRHRPGQSIYPLPRAGVQDPRPTANRQPARRHG